MQQYGLSFREAVFVGPFFFGKALITSYFTEKELLSQAWDLRILVLFPISVLKLPQYQVSAFE